MLPILVLGEAWEDVLLIFQLPFSGSMACGVGALLALDRRDRLGDVLATALLTGSLFFSDVGIVFVVGATLEIALTRERWHRAYVVGVPTALFAVWYLGWGHSVETNVSFDNFLNLPTYVTSGFASGLSSLLGLGVRGLGSRRALWSGADRCSSPPSRSLAGASTCWVGRPAGFLSSSRSA